MTNETEKKDVVAMTGDNVGKRLLKALVQEVQQLQRPWQNTSAYEQQLILDRLTSAVETAVTDAVLTLASDGQTRMRAQVESVAFKDGVKAVLKLASGQKENHELADATGGQVLIVLANVEEHTGGARGSIKPDPDQHEMFNKPKEIKADELQDMAPHDRLYVLALQHAQANGWVSLLTIKNKFECSDADASDVVDRMQANGVLGNQNPDGSWPVIKKGDEGQEKNDKAA